MALGVACADRIAFETETLATSSIGSGEINANVMASRLGISARIDFRMKVPETSFSKFITLKIPPSKFFAIKSMPFDACIPLHV